MESSKGKDPHQQFLQVGAALTKMMEEFKGIICSVKVIVDIFCAITAVTFIQEREMRRITKRARSA